MTRHVSASIERLLQMDDTYLSDVFSADAKEIRKDLAERRARGELKIGSQGCEGFCPIKGCPGHNSEEKEGGQNV